LLLALRPASFFYLFLPLQLLSLLCLFPLLRYGLLLRPARFFCLLLPF
jgi:hypothetical protein